ncbi:anti-anti-sigma factor [Bacillus canaveralius]|uniref:Anti-sigma factor antagonist n=1 Tax=Bacillus canaveralius TaxID=1403243 RepID=A0A2N5GN28_9BACI|nr:STAS domain-containing protein [Bacillus canaveralius]PLR83548.1 anti-anti-sigma factor [Bacillus canaveralius]PLS00734.1 anti-anti-sigma factor [Bacillus canaveralius]RSK48623.1 anti-sigma factor antagonist [Bacillus canaveralius]
MSLSVKKEMQSSKVILKINGVLDISTTRIINPYLEDLEDIEALVLDLSELEFIDSTGIGSIMSAIYLSDEKKFKLILQGIDELTDEVFETVGLYKILEVYQGEVV